MGTERGSQEPLYLLPLNGPDTPLFLMSSLNLAPQWVKMFSAAFRTGRMVPSPLWGHQPHQQL